MLANEVYLQYAFNRQNIEAVLSAFAEAHQEDLCENPDMFDLTRDSFSGKMHPNGRLRALEAELAEWSEDDLLFLAALIDAGMELSQGLAHADSPREMSELVAAIYRERAAEKLSAPVLSHRLTEPKAGLLLKRLSLVARILSGENQ